ncbi:glycoside hydrolase family 105 protein [Bacteroides sp. 519]|uniref:glycoside hydrolase family 88/105 protein n=1 Tax=Bacteroides sp. 519 TaxID=2302937 RepID=UPI0013D3ECD0|nr:glycoside hydrolase family 88 protein [Bacteroides sp. 519]NDV59061.1 glycoside hydrolase family 88 protein [Bacteroides sp. 519]
MKPLLTPFLAFLLLVNLSCSGNKERDNIKLVMKQVANWQMENFTYKTEGNLHDYGIDAWTNGVLYLGIFDWAEATGDTLGHKWLMSIGTENNWTIPANFANYPKYSLYHADELCVAQFYLSMYGKYKQPEMLASVRQRADWIMHNPADSSMSYRNKQQWVWCDALFMAPPVYAQLSDITGNTAYLDFMHENFLKTYHHLYDKEANLFYRDDSYLGKTEANGEKIFWGRGNGWVLAGIINILKQIPADSHYRPYYTSLFVELAARLSKLQNADGFWHASLLDPASYPSPETSATALITYGLAYGVNNKLLNSSYIPTIKKAWEALLTAIDTNGKLGYVQPIGADPKKVTREMTAVYGTGAFLMAGVEMLKLLE